jgi:hypothetical protein
LSYITYQELLARYPQFRSWHEGNESLVNSFAIFTAEADMNSRFAKSFTVPFSPTPPVIKDIAYDLAYAKMMRGVDPQKYGAFYNDVVDRIQRFVDGEDALATGSGTIIDTSNPSDAIWSSTMDYHATHSMLDAENTYTMVSSENLYDSEIERGASG